MATLLLKGTSTPTANAATPPLVALVESTGVSLSPVVGPAARLPSANVSVTSSDGVTDSELQCLLHTAATHLGAQEPLALVAYGNRLALMLGGDGNTSVAVGVCLLLRSSAARAAPSPDTLHRLLLAATTVAMKAHFDDFYVNKYMARIGGLEAPRELAELEAHLFVILLGGRAQVSAEELRSLAASASASAYPASTTSSTASGGAPAMDAAAPAPAGSPTTAPAFDDASDSGDTAAAACQQPRGPHQGPSRAQRRRERRKAARFGHGPSRSSNTEVEARDRAGAPAPSTQPTLRGVDPLHVPWRRRGAPAAHRRGRRASAAHRNSIAGGQHEVAEEPFDTPQPVTTVVHHHVHFHYHLPVHSAPLPPSLVVGGAGMIVAVFGL